MAVLDKREGKFIKYALPAFLWALVIFIVSSIPGSDIPELFSCQDILFHFLVYAVLGWFIARAIRNYYPGSHYMFSVYITVLLGLIYAVSDEFHQAFVPYRCPSVSDVCIDGIGVVIGSILFTNRDTGMRPAGISPTSRKE